MDRDLWWPQISQGSDRAFPCPRCTRGRIRLDKGSVKLVQPVHNANLVNNSDDFEPDWIVHHFVGFFRCDQADCGEVVAFSGDTEHVEVETEYGWGLEEALRIKTFFPAPPIFQIPKETPESVKQHVASSFTLYWIDFSSCAARIRAGIEEMLNECGIPATKVNSNQKVIRLDLNGRIDLFKASDQDNGEFLNALRVLGNIGAHETTLDREKVMDAYGILENVLLEVYAQKSAKLKALRDKIVSTKGKY